MNENVRNTQIMIVAAAVMTRAVSTCPVRTATEFRRPCTHSSFIRLTRNTW